MSPSPTAGTERALTVQPRFRLTAENAVAVAEITARRLTSEDLPSQASANQASSRLIWQSAPGPQVSPTHPSTAPGGAFRIGANPFEGSWLGRKDLNPRSPDPESAGRACRTRVEFSTSWRFG
jgi:hypothetical protein